MANRSSSAFRLLLTALAVCAVNLMSLDSAQATCGDYLSHTGQNETSHYDLLSDPAQPPPARPCSGPGCEKQHPDPAPETPILVTTVFKAACTGGWESVTSPQRQKSLVNSSHLLSSSAYQSRIDRPPEQRGF
ncbi:hypothetical protein [Gimesia sp.]|uniref:hypothetical protein n=1 Tax=Gimesia sp. TaxID=2024833 RepID=UPI000C64F1A4|nr:hypothetical protein [Gimesia sp.]MAX35003.1 hypothetical protein [Gimesia sp.]HAH44461.1 hypothetical protein [Planctomycetaceae bacterium]HBL45519.1 hypothetical protein [Planctomycetaceae bacterium]|tara:strand:- start:38 stop:436 length:399 start_codon:yes stop_codon:yes gene_type:complete